MRTEHDPIEQVRARLLARKWTTEDGLKKIDAEVRRIVNDAAEFATHDAEPAVSDALDGPCISKPRTASDMPTPVLMPALSPTMEKGNLAKWHKKEGDSVKSGDVIAEIETDKATMEVEAVDEGTLGKILVPEGTNDVAVNTPIAMILGEGEDASAVKEGNGGGPDAAPQKPAQQQKRRPPTPRSATRSPRPPLRNRCRCAPKAVARARRAGRHRDGHDDGARSAARRHGRRDAARQGRVRDGRGGRGISGRLQGHAGPAAGIRRHARDRYADHRARLCRARHRRGAQRAQADRRVHDFQLRHAGDGPAHQFCRQDPLHVGRADPGVDRVPRTEWSGRPGRRPAQPGFHVLVFAHPGTQSGRALHRRRRQRACSNPRSAIPIR